MVACHLAIYRTLPGDQTGPLNTVKSGMWQLSREAGSFGSSGQQSPSMHVLLETEFAAAPALERAGGHRGSSSLAAGSIVLLSAILISPGRLCWKTHPGETGSFWSKARAVFPPLLCHWCVPPGRKSASGRWLRAARSPTAESSQMLPAPSHPLCLLQCWALGPGASVKGLSSHSLCKEDCGEETRTGL